MKKEHKKYSPKDSCLYKILTKKRLCETLFITQSVLDKLVANGDNNYKVKIVNKDKKPREVQIIGKWQLLYKIHKRISFLLSSMNSGEYLFSGTKGKSYIDNAKFHLENSDQYVVKIDIERFFPSVSFDHIFDYFRDKMKCSHNVAKILAKITTFNEHLPTGSPDRKSVV